MSTSSMAAAISPMTTLHQKKDNQNAQSAFLLVLKRPVRTKMDVSISVPGLYDPVTRCDGLATQSITVPTSRVNIHQPFKDN
jgi:hypothetical protein